MTFTYGTTSVTLRDPEPGDIWSLNSQVRYKQTNDGHVTSVVCRNGASNIGYTFNLTVLVEGLDFESFFRDSQGKRIGWTYLGVTRYGYFEGNTLRVDDGNIYRRVQFVFVEEV